MIEIIHILGREYPIECKGKAEAIEARRLAVSLEKRLEQFLGNDGTYHSNHTHGMILVGLQLERELEMSIAQEQSDAVRKQEQEFTAMLADLQQERNILRTNNEKLVKREQMRLQKIQRLEQTIDRMLAKFSNLSEKD